MKSTNIEPTVFDTEILKNDIKVLEKSLEKGDCEGARYEIYLLNFSLKEGEAIKNGVTSNPRWENQMTFDQWKKSNQK